MGWTQTEISNGRFKMTNEDGWEISVFADFSGVVNDPEGNIIEFDDLRVFIDAGKLLETALTEYYGGYK